MGKKKKSTDPRHIAWSNRRFAVLMMDAGFEGPIWRAAGRAIDGMDKKNTPLLQQNSRIIEEAIKRTRAMNNPPATDPEQTP